jgi:hypothetical protein
MKQMLKDCWNTIVEIVLSCLKECGQYVKKKLYAALYIILDKVRSTVASLKRLLKTKIGTLLITIGTGLELMGESFLDWYEEETENENSSSEM